MDLGRGGGAGVVYDAAGTVVVPRKKADIGVVKTQLCCCQ